MKTGLTLALGLLLLLVALSPVAGSDLEGEIADLAEDFDEALEGLAEEFEEALEENDAEELADLFEEFQDELGDLTGEFNEFVAEHMARVITGEFGVIRNVVLDEWFVGDILVRHVMSIQSGEGDMSGTFVNDVFLAISPTGQVIAVALGTLWGAIDGERGSVTLRNLVYVDAAGFTGVLAIGSGTGQLEDSVGFGVFTVTPTGTVLVSSVLTAEG